MLHSELLHRFFDEGLDEPLEDVLFGQMALDPELRREFISHLKFHSIVQEDVAGITTPSHVSRQLFTTLGLTPPEMLPVTPVARLRNGAGAAWLRLRTFAVAHRQHLYTAVLSALVTTMLLLNFTAPRVELLVDELPSADAVAPEISVSISDAGETPRETSRPSAPAAPMATPMAAISATAVPPVTQAVLADASLPTPMSIPQRDVPTDGEGGRIPEDAGVDIAGLPVQDAPWRFSQPGPRMNILSNMVFELRKIHGTSYPDVDAPHNSFTVFQDMAISAVYKTTEHHAFGFEYGRESFGREFQRSIEEQGTTLDVDPSMAQIYRPPVAWLNGPQRENRMLDVFGAVWQLSLPEYGMFDLVYPYLRSFVGATKLGPLGKVRAGLEMYPSNFSMLNVGVEGGMLRYTVDDQTYYTAKLNFTFGVAIGF